MKPLFLLLLLCCQVPAAWAGERILALAPHICEMLAAIGAGDEVVGISQYCDYPESLQHKPVIANYGRLFTEAALRLDPSMIVTFNPALTGLADLEQRGSRIVESHPQTVGDIFADMERLGRLTGHAGQAEQVIGRMRAELAAMRAAEQQPVRVFFEVWSDPLMTEGGKSFITEVLKEAGGENVFADRDTESMRLNVESVVRANPEIIVIPSRSGDIGSRVEFWRRWLPQVRVVAVDPDIVSRPGPRIVEGIAALRQQFGGGKR